MILRDDDDTEEWNGAGDGSFEERTYLLQNWRADVVAILDPNGEPIEAGGSDMRWRLLCYLRNS